MSQSSVTLDKYEILEEIGRGGFATVYKARDTEMGREVALKVITGNHAQDSEFISSFRALTPFVFLSQSSLH